MMKWSKKAKSFAALTAIAAAIFFFLAQRAPQSQLSGMWKLGLPILASLIFFSLSGLCVAQKERIEKLRALPGIEYPFKLLFWQTAAYVFFLLMTLGIYLGLTLFPYGILRKIFFSLPALLLLLAALFFVVLGGGQLIIRKKKDAIIYRDAASPSRLSRQDYAYSLVGHWDDGLIVGWLFFPYKNMRSFDQQASALVIRGYQDSEPYVLVLYTPRIQEIFLPLLRRAGIPSLTETLSEV